LDWLNFFLAVVQTGVGPFLAIYLAGYAWNEERVGLALTVGGIAGILTQTPAGALVDRLRSKRALIAAGTVALAAGALLIAFAPAFWSVMSAQVLIGGLSSIFGPAICAVSLGVVGHTLFDARQGRNQSFNSAGNVIAALSMVLLGYFVAKRSIFFFVVACTIPTFLALLLIRLGEIDYERARGGKEATEAGRRGHARRLQRDAEGSAVDHLPGLCGDVSLCERRDAAAVGRNARQGAWPKLNDVHVGVRRDHPARDHVDRVVVGTKGEGVGKKAPPSRCIRCPAGSGRSLSERGLGAARCCNTDHRIGSFCPFRQERLRGSDDCRREPSRRRSRYQPINGH
jgi:hypothetical protein